jgi:hypothetical protein
LIKKVVLDKFVAHLVQKMNVDHHIGTDQHMPGGASMDYYMNSVTTFTPRQIENQSTWRMPYKYNHTLLWGELYDKFHSKICKGSEMPSLGPVFSAFLVACSSFIAISALTNLFTKIGY